MKSVLSFIWDKTPWWVKWPGILLGTPTMLVLYFLSWHSSSIHSAIIPYERARDAQIKSIEEKQAIQLQSINENLKRIDQHQTLMFEAMLNRK